MAFMSIITINEWIKRAKELEEKANRDRHIKFEEDKIDIAKQQTEIQEQQVKTNRILIFLTGLLTVAALINAFTAITTVSIDLVKVGIRPSWEVLLSLIAMVILMMGGAFIAAMGFYKWAEHKEKGKKD